MQKQRLCYSENIITEWQGSAAQEYEKELLGTVSMSVLDYYHYSFISLGFAREHVERVLGSAGTDDYQKLVALLHARSRPNSAISLASSGPSIADA